MRPRLPVVWAIVALAGCSIESGGLRPDPGGRVDAAIDAALLDAGGTPVVRPLDAGLDDGELPVDAGDQTDTGTSECEDGASSCSPDGTELLGCAEGRITRLACAAGCDPDALDCRDVPSCDLTVRGDLVPGMDEAVTQTGPPARTRRRRQDESTLRSSGRSP